MSKCIEVCEGFHRGLGLAKHFNCNQILDHVVDQDYIYDLLIRCTGPLSHVHTERVRVDTDFNDWCE